MEIAKPLNKKFEIINIMCHNLPYDLSNQLYKEFESRLKEIEFLINKYPYYKTLRKQMKTVKLLLALSIYHKRIISNLSGAVKFHSTIEKKSQSDIIQIGSYDFDTNEKNKMYSVLIGFEQIKQRFSISDTLFEYYETKQFLKQLVQYQKNISEFFIQEKNNDKEKKQKNNKESDETDLPF